MQAINQQALVVLDSADSTTMKISDSQKASLPFCILTTRCERLPVFLNDEAEYLSETNDAELETT